jgi:hypothetical protein
MYGGLQALAGLPDIPALTAGGGETDGDSNQIMVQLAAHPTRNERIPTAI